MQLLGVSTDGPGEKPKAAEEEGGPLVDLGALAPAGLGFDVAAIARQQQADLAQQQLLLVEAVTAAPAAAEAGGEAGAAHHSPRRQLTEEVRGLSGSVQPQ